MFDVPIAFFIFNRPNSTRDVLANFRALRPARLFVVADGPRLNTISDVDRCKKTREVIDEIDWPCEVSTLYSSENMGLKLRVETGLDWVFSHVDRIIFVEDDNDIHQDYFYFAERMLKKYEHDLRIRGIQAFCGAPPGFFDASYSFSVFHHPWGRAFWKRTWDTHDRSMALLPWVISNHALTSVFPKLSTRKYWERGLEDTVLGRHKSWSFPFNLSAWLQSGLSIVPCRNLVRNTGVGEQATNTRVDDGQASLPMEPMPAVETDPFAVLANWRYDKFIMDEFHHFPSIFTRVGWKLQLFRRWISGGSAQN